MILEMSRLRVLGPRDAFQAVLGRVQDLGLMHVIEPARRESLSRLSFSTEQERHVRNLHRVADDVETAIALLGEPASSSRKATEALTLPRAALIAGRVRRQLEALEERKRSLEQEKALVLKFRGFFSTFEELAASELDLDGIRVFYLLLRGDGGEDRTRLRAALEASLGDGFELFDEPSGAGGAAMILAVAAEDAAKTDALLGQAGVQPLALPKEFEEHGIGSTVRKMRARLEAIPRELLETENERALIAAKHGRVLSRIRASLQDHLARINVMEKAAVTPRAFVLEGWVPRSAKAELERRLYKSFGDSIEVEELSSEQWEGETAPVVLRNPRLFRPFEAITRMMPLPRYGSIDPTPFVAVFFPMFFGIALGDVGYGSLLALASLGLRLRSKAHTKLRAVSEIGLACALFSVIFGFLYGELFGDLGHRIGLEPILFSREETVVPFLALALALGLVHIVIGLGLGAVHLARSEPRRAIGRALAAAMILLLAAALLAAFEVLPRSFFTPMVIAALVAFPVLVIAEGILAPIELVSTLANVLSYARIMAVGTASVMMAVVANRMVGAFGPVAVGVLFAVVFHLLNLVIGVFSPTIHMLRLHYVEFFGKFFSPGGVEYEPFRHWSPREDAA